MFPAALAAEYLPGSVQGSQSAAGALILSVNPRLKPRESPPRPHSSRVARHSLPCIRCTQNCCGLS